MTKTTAEELQRGITFVPEAQSPMRSGAIIQVGSDDVTDWVNNGWFKCDGSEYSESTYAQLFNSIGTKYNTGGETASHFRVPNGSRRSNIFIPDFNEVAPNFTPSSGAWAYIEQDLQGNWFLTASIPGTALYSTFNPQAAWGVGTIQGVSTWDDGSNSIQPIRVTGTGSANAMVTDAWIGNSGNIASQTSNNFAGNESLTFVYSRVRLQSKPSDALIDVSDPNYSTIDEALESQPMIKVYDDYINGSVIGLVPATDTVSGTIIRNSSYAATDSLYGFIKMSQDPTAWTPSDAGSANMSGTGSYLNPTYMVIGKKVFVEIDTITGLTTTATGTMTLLLINSTDLPGITNATYFGGSALWYFASGNRYKVAGIKPNGSGDTIIEMGIDSDNSGGAVGVTTISGIRFSYTMA